MVVEKVTILNNILSPRDALLRDQLPTLGGGGGNWSV